MLSNSSQQIGTDIWQKELSVHSRKTKQVELCMIRPLGSILIGSAARLHNVLLFSLKLTSLVSYKTATWGLAYT